MTITRAKKKAPSKTAKAERAELTPEEFIAAADAKAPSRATALAVAQSREEMAEALVRRYIPWSAGAGLVPVPWLDLATIGVVQLRMIAKLAELYGIEFREQAVKSFVATSLSTLLQYTFTGPIAWAVKAVPLAGSLLSVAVLPALAAATSYALGRVFIAHFEAGGTLLDFDAKKLEAHFRAELDRARAGMKGSASAAAA